MDLLSQMATFVRVVDGQSLSAAARALRLSLPAVSRQLSALEADLGASLVVRSTRRLHVTEAGRRYYEHCRRVLREIEDARNDVHGGGAVTGTLVVSASFTYGHMVLAPLLPRLVAKHPRLAIELRLEDRLTDLAGEGVDVAIRAGASPPDSATVVAHPIARMHRILVAAPRLLRRYRSLRSPDDLAALPKLVQVTLGGAIVRWMLVRGDDVRTVEAEGRLRSSAPFTLRDLAVAGAGVAYVPSWIVEEDLAAGRLRHVLPAWTSPAITAFALFRTELRGAARLRVLLDALAEAPGFTPLA